MSSSESITKRLHVGGITPNITTTHLKDRFKSFGTVRTVDELAPDALGTFHQYTVSCDKLLISRPTSSFHFFND